MSTVEARGIWKAFDGALALRGVDLAIDSGSIHALIGENGAGKSTLIKVLTGVHRADRGTVRVAGEERQFVDPQEAIAAGISAVYQERNLVPDFSVAENLFLHDTPRRAGFLHYERMYRDAQIWLERVGLHVSPRASARSLSVAQGQLVEIARALTLDAKVLFLDEPTASITETESAVLFGILRELRDRGRAMLFVSHKLDEVFEICDSITVIRDGETVINATARADLTHGDVITAMVGRSVSFAGRQAKSETVAREPLLALRDVSTQFGHRNLNLALEPGCVVGLYGLVGAGRTELARAIVGLEKITGGAVISHSKAKRIANPHEALHEHRIGYVSEDRKGEGLILAHSVSHNVGITIWDQLRSLLGFITPEREVRAVAPLIGKMSVKLSSLDQPVGQLSGGNQQKVSVAKWLAGDVDVLIIDEPTIGVDVRTKEEMYLLIEELSQRGKAILVISSDLAEVIRISDRIAVMANKRLVANLANTGDYEVLSEQVMQAIVSAQPHDTADAAANGELVTEAVR
ncbi:sugar ABC transporter ATP-binding protein [Paraburkholderia sp. MM5482-R1]|uniref:sugar ABC transporter ATP-binding protein n=1 Tax=unclassified Paraburkholderia TaxID=2615204 RepID=UPI003D1B2DE7